MQSQQKEERIKAALSKLSGVEKFFGKREINELPRVLWEDELPEAIVQGTYESSHGLLIATNKRVIFLDKGIISFKMEDFAFDKISSIEFKSGMIWGEIVVYSSGTRSIFKDVYKDKAREFVDYLRARVSGVSEHASVKTVSDKPPTNAVVDDSRVVALEKLAALKERGVLSAEEFDSEKRRILNT